MARASQASATRKTAAATAAKKRTTTRASRSAAANAITDSQSAQVKHLGALLAQQRKAANAVEKKLATVRARVKKARERAQTTKTKASENALIKARSDASELNQQINQLRDEIRETRHKLKMETLLSSIVEAEKKAEQSLMAAREKLDAQAEDQLDKALARFEISWMKKKTAEISRQLKKVEKAASARVATVEKKVLSQVRALEKKADSGVNTGASPSAGTGKSESKSARTRPSRSGSLRTGSPATDSSPAASSNGESSRVEEKPRRGRPRKKTDELTKVAPAKAASRAPARARGTAGKGEVKSTARATPRRRGRPPKAVGVTE